MKIKSLKSQKKLRAEYDQLPIFYSSDEFDESKIAKIQDLISSKSQNYLFRNTLINSLLDNLISEISKIDSNPYEHDISLNSSFVRRANPIFANSDEVYSISVDSYSSFWTSPELKYEAIKYTEIQPPNTRRLFVFSSPYNMMKHRKILSQHYERYGTDGEVMFTSTNVWNKYLKHLDKIYPSSDQADGRNWIGFQSGGDFAILRYQTLVDASYIETILSKNQLQFRRLDGLSDLHRDIINNMRFNEQDGFEREIDGAGYIYRWNKDFADDDESWFKIVASVFHDYNLYDSDPYGGIKFVDSGRIVHMVMFSNLIDSEKFASLIRQVTPILLGIKNSSGRKTVQSIWYGGVRDASSEMIDPLHKGGLFIKNEINSTWPHCLIVRFKSRADLEEYYENQDHADIRIRLYQQFSDEIADVIKGISESNDDKTKILLGKTLEVMVSSYMKRLDFENYDPVALFKYINSTF